MALLMVFLLLSSQHLQQQPLTGYHLYRHFRHVGGVFSWAMNLKISSLYFIPYCGVPIIFRILFDTRVALNIHLLMVLITALFVPNSYDFVFLQFMSGLVAIYGIKTMVKREQFLILQSAHFGYIYCRSYRLGSHT